jgi:hypothetical protein
MRSSTTAGSFLGVFRARLDANLTMFDELDDAIAWPFAPGSTPADRIRLT